MSATKYHGVSDDSLRNDKDIRTGSKKFFSDLTPKKVSLIPAAAIASSFMPMMQNSAEALILAGALPLSLMGFRIDPKLPFYKPVYQTRQHSKDGLFFLGNETGTQKEIWISDSEARRHVLYMGTTGAGKSESLISLVANTLATNSAFTYVDGKADTGLFAKIFSLCRRFGREDDLLVINYMVGTLNADLKRDKKLSNTLNPFARETAELLSELVNALLPSGGGDGIWKERAGVFMSALIKSLVSLRDNGHLLLDVGVIRDHFTLEKIVGLSKDTRIPEKDRAGLINYVLNLPGYQPEKGDDQEPTVYDQHGYVVMQWQPSFGMLADTYGHIMKTQLADCSFMDIILQRRILLVLLPALEKSPANLANLGKVIISSMKGMMAGALGAELEGETEYILDAKPTNGRTYQCVFDEYGYYSVEGAAVLPAQARGLGFSLVFAGQDYQAFKKGSEEEAASIKANCATKVCMALEDPTETAEIFTRGAGQGTKAVEKSAEKESGMFGTRLVGSRTVEFEKVDRIDARDLKNQDSGEFHIINRDDFARGRSFYANPMKLKSLRVNSFIRVKPPEFEEVARVKDSLAAIKKKYNQFNKSDEARLDETWRETVDAESLDLSKAVNFSHDSSPLKQVAIAFAIRKNKIDLVDQSMILSVKELEDHLNKKVIPDDELFDDSYAVTEGVEHKDTLNTRKMKVEKSKQELIEEVIAANDIRLAGILNSAHNPMALMRTDIDEVTESVSSISQSMIKRWREMGVLKASTAFFQDELQAKLAKKSAQETMIQAMEAINEVNTSDLEACTEAENELNNYADSFDGYDGLDDPKTEDYV